MNKYRWVEISLFGEEIIEVKKPSKPMNIHFEKPKTNNSFFINMSYIRNNNLLKLKKLNHYKNELKQLKNKFICLEKKFHE